MNSTPPNNLPPKFHEKTSAFVSFLSIIRDGITIIQAILLGLSACIGIFIYIFSSHFESKNIFHKTERPISYVDSEDKNSIREFTALVEYAEIPNCSDKVHNLLNFFKRTSPTQWINQRPGGEVWHLDVVGRINVNDCQGTETRSIENGYSVFIPDRGCAPMMLKVIVPPDPEWKDLGKEMKYVD